MEIAEYAMTSRASSPKLELRENGDHHMTATKRVPVIVVSAVCAAAGVCAQSTPRAELEVAKGGLKMQESATDTDVANTDAKAPVSVTGSGSAQGVSVNLGRGSSYAFSNNKFEAKRLTMAALAANLERFMDRPIVDTTG